MFTIKIVPYRGSQINIPNVKSILPNSEIEVYNASPRGKTIEPSFGTLLQPYDSVLVSYNDSIKIGHMKFNSPVTYTRKIDFTNNRNISNSDASWIKKIISENKYSITGVFTCTFFQQDYLNAR